MKRDNSKTQKQCDAELEKAADELLREHGGFGKDKGYYPERALSSRRRAGKEISLEEADLAAQVIDNTIADVLWKDILRAAKRQGCTNQQIELLHYRKSGLNFREISKLTGVPRPTLQYQLKDAAKRIESDPEFGIHTVLSEVFKQ